MKPILIDALHINMGGALMILNYLIDHLINRHINFVLLKDIRCPQLRSEHEIKNIEIMASSIRERNRYYKRHKKDFSTVLCLGNIPPCIKMDVPVHTYIHNVSLLKIPKDNPLFIKLLNYLKRAYIRYYAKNTNTWIVQTDNTKNIVSETLPCKTQRILVYPFYYIPKDINRQPIKDRNDYIFVGEHTKAKGHEYLVDAWIKLHQLGFDRKLHLTVSTPHFVKTILKAQQQGAQIINHGYVDFGEVIKLYNLSKATIYPSLNESLGLGIIEAIEAGCDVIGCDLPYIHTVCIPSETFVSRNSDSIVEAVLRYENNSCPVTILKIKDMVEELIDFLICSSQGLVNN